MRKNKNRAHLVHLVNQSQGFMPIAQNGLIIGPACHARCTVLSTSPISQARAVEQAKDTHRA
jgi:hypothetical protein